MPKKDKAKRVFRTPEERAAIGAAALDRPSGVTLKDWCAETGNSYSNVLKWSGEEAERRRQRAAAAKRAETRAANRAGAPPSEAPASVAPTSVSSTGGPPSFRDALREAVRQEIAAQLPDAIARYMLGGQ